MAPPTKIAPTTSRFFPPTKSISPLPRSRSHEEFGYHQRNLDNQRNAVQEERRLGVDNQPYGKSGEVQQELIYDNFAYKHSVIGSMDDLNAATIEDVSSFFKMYYAPNNAVLVLVGDFKTADASRRFAPTSRAFHANRIHRQST